MITRDTLTVIQPASWMFLYCPECSGRFSADPDDYWYMAPLTPFTCEECGCDMVLAEERTRIDVVAE